MSGGIPRLMNTLATQALVQAMAEGKRVVDGSVVAAVERDLRWPGGEPPPGQAESEPWWT